MSPVELKWTEYNVFYEKIKQGIYRGRYPQDLGLFHCYTKIRMKIALHAFKCLKRYLPPKKVQDYPFWCGLHSFLAHVKAAIDSLAEEINLLYEIAPQPETKRWRMSIESLQREENMRRLKRSNHKLFTEISTATKASWFMDLKKLRDEEAIHGALSGKNWHAVLGGDSPTITVGIMGVPDLTTWCPDILKETNKFLERCYKQM